MNIIYLFSILLFIFSIIFIFVKYSTPNNIQLSKNVDKNIVNQAIKIWSNKFKDNVIFDISIEKKDINEDFYLASSSIDKFKYNYVDGTITLYPPFFMQSENKKLMVLLHEIGHLLGIGTKWKTKDKLYKKDYPYTIREYNSKFNKNVDFIHIKNGHWDEIELQDDIMSSNGGENINISNINLMNLKDIGWNI